MTAFIFIFIWLGVFAQAGDACKNWFLNSKIDPSSKGCELRCSVLPKSMATFDCSNRCPDFCQIKKCKPDAFWKEKIKSGRPNKWDFDSEKSVQWKEVEREKALRALSRLPEVFKTLNFNGIYRMRDSVGIINPGTSTKKEIILYDRAFDGPFYTDRILAHEMAHILYFGLPQKQRSDYMHSLEWKQSAGEYIRSGGFVDQNGKISPEEDFATNIEYFLFEPEKLKSMNSAAYRWMARSFGLKFQLSDGCGHDQ